MSTYSLPRYVVGPYLSLPPTSRDLTKSLFGRGLGASGMSRGSSSAGRLLVIGSLWAMWARWVYCWTWTHSISYWAFSARIGTFQLKNNELFAVNIVVLRVNFVDFVGSAKYVYSCVRDQVREGLSVIGYTNHVKFWRKIPKIIS